MSCQCALDLLQYELHLIFEDQAVSCTLMDIHFQKVESIRHCHMQCKTFENVFPEFIFIIIIAIDYCSKSTVLVLLPVRGVFFFFHFFFFAFHVMFKT